MKTHTHHEVKDHLSEIAEDTRALLTATAHATEETVVEARNRLTGALEAARETCATVQRKAVEGAKATDKAIRANPYQSMAIAFGVGALVGFFMARRKRE